MVNLIFAISALSSNANDKFQKMKDIIKTMVDEYGKERIHYSLIVFGDEPSVELRFSRSFDSDGQLKAFIDVKKRATDGANLDSALKKTSELFDEYQREGAKNVLVVIMDKKSTSDGKDVKNTAMSLWDDDVEVIPIAFGRETDENELKSITPHVDNVIPAYVTNKTNKIAMEIMDKMRKGMSEQHTESVDDQIYFRIFEYLAKIHFLTTFAPLWFIQFISLVFIYLSKLLFSSFH